MAQQQDKPQYLLFFENLAVTNFTFTALHFADKFSNEQQILKMFEESSTSGESKSQKIRD